MLMDMKEKMWCNTERNSLPDGRTTKNGWSHMTRMATLISPQPDFPFHRATAFDSFWSLMMSPRSMPMTEERLNTTTPARRQLLKKRAKVLRWWYLTCLQVSGAGCRMTKSEFEQFWWLIVLIRFESQGGASHFQGRKKSRWILLGRWPTWAGGARNRHLWVQNS